MAYAQPDGIPFSVLGNTSRCPLSIEICPTESEELKWISSPGPGYSKEKAEEFLRNRYEVSQKAVALTLPKLIQDARCRKIILGLRTEGFLDWQILGMISSIVIQYQVETEFPDQDPRSLSKQMTNRIYRRERNSDPEFDLSLFSAETVAMQKKVGPLAALRTWGLECHRQTPNFEATKKLLDVRYGHSMDDIPHQDPFEMQEDSDSG